MARSKKSNKKEPLVKTNQELESTRIRKSFHEKDLILIQIQPKTDNQNLVFDSYKNNKQLFLYGCAGTGKTFLSLFLSLKSVLRKEYDKVYIVRSVVPVRDIGFLPGTEEEKIEVYEAPYKQICNELFPYSKSYDNLKLANKMEFIPTSFIRGITLNDCIVIVDETQNMTFEELSSIITRMGDNSKIIFCGDNNQNDLHYKKSDVSGFLQFLNIIKSMYEFDCIQHR